jgi:phosphoadenosine phosphosulfate reductase
MPLDIPEYPKDQHATLADVTPQLAHVARLNAQMKHHSAPDVLRLAVAEIPDLVLVSSFGAESVALLHICAMITREIPVIFVNTQMLFAETLVYQHELAERLGLNNLRIVEAQDIAQQDPDGTLHRTNPDACCAARKVAPLHAALDGTGGWITGRKRFQSKTRAALSFFEVEAKTTRIKVNPLAHWQAQDVRDYIEENRLPRHPMVARGYPSIGCAPCTSAVSEGEDLRAGRWRATQKEECGIHLVDGKMIRAGVIT